jgi:hypothetical protein
MKLGSFGSFFPSCTFWHVVPKKPDEPPNLFFSFS